MRPDRITIMISGTLRGTNPLPHADNASMFYLSPGLLHGHRSSAVRGLSCIFSDGVGGHLWQVPYLASHRLVKQNLRGALPLRTPAPNTK